MDIHWVSHKNNRDFPWFSVCNETMLVFYDVSEYHISVKFLTGYHMHVHTQDMMIVANLAGSLSFLRRLSVE